MGQLERYGLYVLCVVIFLILGVALWGGDPAVLPPTSSTALEVERNQAPVTPPPPARDDVVERLRREFSSSSVRNPAAPPLETAVPLAGVRDAASSTEHAVLTGVTPGPVVATAAGVAREYDVQKGDALETIAEQQLGAKKHWRDILKENPGLVPTRLQPGTKIKLPGIARAPEASTPTPRRDVYVVQKNDVLGAIAQRQLGDTARWKDIVAANPGLDPLRLKPGMELKLPSRDPVKDGR